MKLLLLTVFVAVFSSVNGGKTARLLAAMNAGMLNGMMAGGLNPPLVAGGGVGLIGQSPFAQFVPGLPAFAVRAPMPNMFPAAVNPYQFPMMGAPQMPQINPPQQLQMGMAGGAMQQQPFFQPPIQAQPPAQPPFQPLVQPNPAQRFRRQTLKSENVGNSIVDTQIPGPTESTTAPPCDSKSAD
ncbi:secretory calcium-binding phosphoprotein 9 isoform X2 [Girardinichthys multiradiatus]|uniref:secretory calcium-binding phosphoprotein 9 isoform X2 n=1 Tax=Girardinichthys multiradiatus TaxID=208333 RepID=UPI001FADEFB9|nr:secretory calcium-binding phosphoprotein 9 isoform X2 [Girardinichthys multiradiatus]